MSRCRFSLLLVAVLAAFAGCGPSQIGPDKDAFKAVDALYTAVSLRDAGLVDRCAQRLATLQTAGKLPESAGRSLESIAVEAKGGQWEQAQAHLGDFMRGQRR